MQKSNPDFSPLAYVCSLPGAGTGLFQSLLCQHPSIVAVANSPLLELVKGTNLLFSKLHPKSQNEHSNQLSNLNHESFLVNACHGLISNFYKDFAPKLVVDFGGIAALQYEDLLKRVYPSSPKIIFLVRDLRSIVASKIKQNPADSESIDFAAKLFGSAPYASFLRSLIALIRAGRVKDYFFMRYEDLTFAPEASMSLLFDHLEIENVDCINRKIEPNLSSQIFQSQKLSESHPYIKCTEYIYEENPGKACSHKIIGQFPHYYAALYPDRCAMELDHIVPFGQTSKS